MCEDMPSSCFPRRPGIQSKTTYMECEEPLTTVIASSHHCGDSTNLGKISNGHVQNITAAVGTPGNGRNALSGTGPLVGDGIDLVGVIVLELVIDQPLHAAQNAGRRALPGGVQNLDGVDGTIPGSAVVHTRGETRHVGPVDVGQVVVRTADANVPLGRVAEPVEGPELVVILVDGRIEEVQVGLLADVKVQALAVLAAPGGQPFQTPVGRRFLDVEHWDGQPTAGLVVHGVHIAASQGTAGHDALPSVVDAAGVDDVAGLDVRHDLLLEHLGCLRAGQGGREAMEGALEDLVDAAPDFPDEVGGLLHPAVGRVTVRPHAVEEAGRKVDVDPVVALGRFGRDGAIFRRTEAGVVVEVDPSPSGVVLEGVERVAVVASRVVDVVAVPRLERADGLVVSRRGRSGRAAAGRGAPIVGGLLDFISTLPNLDAVASVRPVAGVERPLDLGLQTAVHVAGAGPGDGEVVRVGPGVDADDALAGDDVGRRGGRRGQPAFGHPLGVVLARAR